MTQKQYIVKGIDCASCANKIEKGLRTLPSIDEVNLDFLTSTLRFHVKDEASLKKTEEEVQALIDRIEPGVTIVAKGEEGGNVVEASRDIILSLSKILLALFIFLVGIILGEESSLYLPLMLLSYILVGIDVVFKAVRNLFQGKVFDEHFLMTIATVGAFGIGTYSEAVAVMLFYQIGELFQSIAVGRSRRSIKQLLSIKPLTANLRNTQGVIEVPVEQVVPGDTILIRPGERIPLDSEVIDGSSLVDMKALTGESAPVFVEVGEMVLSGSINLDGLLTAKVKKSSKDSTVTKVLELVEHASSKKAPTEQFITKFARYYTPAVTLAAFLLAIIPPLFFDQPWNNWLQRAFIFLVISCPCALVISVPLGFFAGIGRSSREGILVKGGNYLEALGEVQTIVFDKTGTLTKGNFTVVDVVVDDTRFSKDLVLEYAALLENHSKHPIARSIVRAYGKAIDEKRVSELQEMPGHGLVGSIDGKKIIIGNERLMALKGIALHRINRVGTILYLAVDGTYTGCLVIQDELKANAKEAMASLSAYGIDHFVMLTGDRPVVADGIADDLGIKEVHANLLPEDKLTSLEAIITRSAGKVMVVGDGINDTPILARSDIAVAMGGVGSDAAIEVSDIVLMNDDLMKLPAAFRIAKKTKRIVWQNIVFALGVKCFFLILGAFGYTTMWEAVFADVGVSILAILNAFRVLNTKY